MMGAVIYFIEHGLIKDGVNLLFMSAAAKAIFICMHSMDSSERSRLLARCSSSTVMNTSLQLVLHYLILKGNQNMLRK